MSIPTAATRTAGEAGLRILIVGKPSRLVNVVVTFWRCFQTS